MEDYEQKYLNELMKYKALYQAYYEILDEYAKLKGQFYELRARKELNK